MRHRRPKLERYHSLVKSCLCRSSGRGIEPVRSLQCIMARSVGVFSSWKGSGGAETTLRYDPTRRDLLCRIVSEEHAADCAGGGVFPYKHSSSLIFDRFESARVNCLLYGPSIVFLSDRRTFLLSSILYYLTRSGNFTTNVLAGWQSRLRRRWIWDIEAWNCMKGFCSNSFQWRGKNNCIHRRN